LKKSQTTGFAVPEDFEHDKVPGPQLEVTWEIRYKVNSEVIVLYITIDFTLTKEDGLLIIELWYTI
jgi:hypothetical protein